MKKVGQNFHLCFQPDRKISVFFDDFPNLYVKYRDIKKIKKTVKSGC